MGNNGKKPFLCKVAHSTFIHFIVSLHFKTWLSFNVNIGTLGGARDLKYNMTSMPHNSVSMDFYESISDNEADGHYIFMLFQLIIFLFF